MTEHPILFSAPMVRAIFDGTKTQTRRVVKPQPAAWMDGREPWNVYGTTWALAMPAVGGVRAAVSEDCFLGSGADMPRAVRWCSVTCPYGARGDRLWVRETWNIARPVTLDGECDAAVSMGGTIPVKLPVGWAVWYAADEIDPGAPLVDRYRPSIHMPRWASRITLEVTDVRVERIQDISEEDAKTEGVELMGRIHPEQVIPRFFGELDAIHRDVPYRFAYSALWDSINGSGAWDANPWVWAITFKRVTP